MTRQQLAERVIEVARVIAAAADDLADETRDRDEIWEMPAAMAITAGDLRRMRELIAAYDAAATKGKTMTRQKLAERVIEAARVVQSARYHEHDTLAGLFMALDALDVALESYDHDAAPEEKP